MEVLQQEDNQFRYKLMNVFFQYIKNALFILLIGYEGIKLLNIDHDCQLSEITYISTLYHGGIIILLFNIVSACYILYQKHFVRIEYFITYGLNMLVFVCMLLFSLQQLIQGSCSIGQLSVKYYIIISFITQLDVLLIMMFKHEFSNRQTNICSNTAVVILLLMTKIDNDCAVNALSLEIQLISANILTLLFFTVLNVAINLFPKLREQLTNAFKFVCVLVLCFLILNYLLIVYFVQSGDIKENQECMPLDFITRTYCFLAPVNLIGMIPILASFKFETIDEEEEDIVVPQQQAEIISPSRGLPIQNSPSPFQQSKLSLNNNTTPYKIIVNNNQLSPDEQFLMGKHQQPQY
ncbi:unnamed protein product (macronuclear) [Paramecium tetraurelia]|uniref:Transmembrane protein n=1 Tax=Paramecium tetraurelia TaxID=5888 RepID=A0DCK8_PARTE|nr:uncharacterized protein GSPATT00015653001 [Paramecium tetraurelia]CAK80775.1 unnamed protein product [Paramecium tetraurelia]|eukprot:XP_001448172.1 hypothetical protein (macronuclear) [Paramecium tetraurelia strain d4-2]